ncbi:hypothetical protein [Bdellovibrio reynosensis]|uniref:Uncharacterized protein n=1 Tax=Bdellovibrio reynosensis TaxID=2835041 RepID=A0ABY4CB71_9BACT|nr:hypothetical protein [Bdellovibrio reynosensis]UOF02160.1 hypothetical protein MNR06_04220 [Bdellovibrio reynosensis]
MKLCVVLSLAFFLILLSCTLKEEPKAISTLPLTGMTNNAAKSVVPEVKPGDKSLENFARYFEQADAIHREAWWVLSNERRPMGKSPFGKIQRALLSSNGIKLSNKSLFSCDRYLVKRDIQSLTGFPQKFEIFEKCSTKTDAKRIAEVFAAKEADFYATFYSENLEEVLGLGATILNKNIRCDFKGNEKNQIVSLKCKDWAQDRSKEQMVRLDIYDYEKEGKNLIKLRGKVYENLSDIRKIEVDIPLEGKIKVLETELYAPEATPVATPAATPSSSQSPPPASSPSPSAKPEDQNAGPAVLEPGDPAQDETGAPLITPLPGVDPDVLMQRQNNEMVPLVQPPGTEEIPRAR